ncbi:FKBP-type peptidyl-prolyl cis-trans isomerase [Parapedobacter koreensis]|uniref:Peptidyl-prolyl cis-trans isomerase n=1 Tax=Parapedobacter koreensis TaxID=332977 RepID=A0A1H7F439_9SPHI|nr:FKBP-type peptidyl-prolyl cis-trans isomerase [Parapedobacter koreensis]SEK18770.1 FKBP-type peptidyl-prolyl cis-trans isomerase [Parapedobacter koreensis]
MIKSTPCLVAGFAAIAFLMGCEKKEYQSFEELDNANILEYIQRNNLNVSQYKETDLFYQVLEEGTGNPIDFTKTFPVVYTVKSLDGAYNSGDTLSFNNRYADYFGYFPFGSSAAGTATVERTGDFKEVIREILQKTNGKIRIIVPSRIMYGRNGVPSQGIPPNASLDYVVTVHDNFEDFEDDWVIPNMIKRAGLAIDEFTKTEDGIYYNILTQGTGDAVHVDSTLTLNYTLKRPDGSIAESNTDYEAKLTDLIPAWNKVIPLLNKGGKIRFFTPSTQAYGASGSSNIPSYASLDFEVEVKDE